MLASLARACVRHRWIVIGVWVALLVIVSGISNAVGPDYRTDFVLPDSESKDVQDLLEANNPERAGFSSQIVIQADQGVDDPAVQERLQALMDVFRRAGGRAGHQPVRQPATDQPGRHDRLRPTRRDGSPFQEVTDLGTTIEDFGEEQPAIQGLTVEYGGDLFGEFELPESEILGIIAAVVILILAFGSVLAMGLPIGTALFGLGIGFALVSLLSYVVTMPDFVTSMVAIGLGVGIDYALFIVTRYREGLRLGLSVEDSVAEAMDTSGRAVLFAGITVIISLMGLTVIGLSFVSGMAVAASVGVLMMILGSLTLLPALLGWVGTRIDNTSRAALIAVTIAVVFSSPASSLGRAGLYLAGLGLAIVFFAMSFAIKPLRKLVPHRRAAQRAALLVSLEPGRPASSVAEPAGCRRSLDRARPPAVRHPPRVRRPREPAGEPDRPAGLRPARRRLRAWVQRPRIITVQGEAVTDEAASVSSSTR